VIQREHRQRHAGHMHDNRNADKILVGKFKKKILHGKARHRWKNSITIKLSFSDKL
jgi:hypothetical protein